MAILAANPLSINQTGSTIPGTAPQQVQPTQQPVKQPSWWEKLLPTAGGILGGIGGTFVSPILGSAAGAAAGGALGQELENKLTGDKQSTLTSGIENGVGGLLGGVGGKLLETGAGAISGLADTGASKLFAAQGPGIGEDLAKTATQHLGINDLPTASKFGEVLSGSTDPTTNADKGLLSKFVEDNAKEDPSTVDVSNLQPAQPGTSKAALQSQSLANTANISRDENPLLTEKLISDNGLQQGDADAIRKQVQGVLGRPANAGSVSKLDLLGMQKQMSGLASDATDVASRTNDPNAIAKSKVLNALNQHLKSQLGFENITVDPKMAQALADDVYTNASPISETGAKAISKDILDKANSDEGLSVADVRNMESNMVQLQQSAKAAIRAKDNNFGTSTADMANTVAGGVAGGRPANILGAIVGKATASPTADKAASSGLSSLADTLSKGDTAATGIQKALGITNKDAGLVNKILPVATRASTIAAANIPNEAPIAPSISATQPTDTTGGNISTGATNMPQSPLEQLYNSIIAQSQSPTGISGNLISTANTLAPMVQKQELAAPVISNLGQAYANAGGAQGLGGGLLARLQALVPGTAANTFQTQQASAASALSNLLGISPAEAATLIPQLMQTPQVAEQRIGGLQSVLGSIAPQSAIPTQ